MKYILWMEAPVSALKKLIDFLRSLKKRGHQRIQCWWYEYEPWRADPKGYD